MSSGSLKTLLFTKLLVLITPGSTVKHILIECRTFAVIRKRFFKVNNLTDLFENIKIDDILSFLRDTELYQKIWQLKTG